MRVHTHNDLGFLLNGRKPTVSGCATPTKGSVCDLSEFLSPPDGDFSAFPPQQTMTPSSIRSESRVARTDPGEEGVLTPRYNKIRGDRPVLDTLDKVLEMHDANTKNKKKQMNRDWEDKYMGPFGDVMRGKLTGRPYTAYRKDRNRAVTALDNRTNRKMIDDHEYNAPPGLQFGTSRLNDRVHMYQKHAQHEQRLEEIVNQGRARTARKAPPKENEGQPRERLVETRFFVGSGVQQAAKGTRVFPGKFKSAVGKQLDCF